MSSREDLVERALRFIAVQQIARTKLTPGTQGNNHMVTVFFLDCPCSDDTLKSWNMVTN